MRKSKLHQKLILVSLIIATVFSFTACFSRFDVSYTASEGGSIQGNKTQTILSGKNAESVTAIPFEGYKFVKWSDGITTATRHDKKVKADINVAAEFERISLSINYLAGQGGSIQGKTEQVILYGENTEEVTAIPDVGYRFIQWSDGLTTSRRLDENITSELTLTAQFELREFIVRYIATTGGYIDGNADQTVLYGYDAEEVTAVPTEGYVFARWSDGNTNPKRQDRNITGTL
jgi:hypothetical protein